MEAAEADAKEKHKRDEALRQLADMSFTDMSRNSVTLGGGDVCEC